MEEKRERKVHLDLLRILAAFSVVMLHSSAQYWYDLDVYSSEWVVANTYDALFRFGVPVFVMLSGSIFLGANYKIEVKRIYQHNIFKIAVLYTVWSCAYGLFDCAKFGFENLAMKDILREMLYGRYHLWFLPMLVGIYALLPILKSWLEHAGKKNIQYILLLFFVLQICRETIRALTVTEELHYILDLIKVEVACGYIGYFIWGYYIVHIGIGPKLRKVIYAMCIPAMVLSVIVSNALTRRAGTAVAAVYDSFSLFTFITSTAIFIFINDKGAKMIPGTKVANVIKELSYSTLGVYVMHLGLMELFQMQGIDTMVIPNIIGIPLHALMCFGICLLLSSVLRRIPVIGRFLC